MPVPKTVPLKDPKDWKLIGKPTRRLDTPEKITGKAQFGIDVQFPGLLTAVVVRPPVFGGKVKSLDDTKAKAIPGVRKVVRVPTGVAVVADHFWAAKLGRDALKIDWDLGPNASLDSATLREEFRKLAGFKGAPVPKGAEVPPAPPWVRELAATKGVSAAQAGNVADAIGKSAKTIEAEYAVPYLAHATMEPMNATVRIGRGKCEIWTGTQFQTLDQQLAARITGLKPEQVEIHTTFLGGGFGRRATQYDAGLPHMMEVKRGPEGHGAEGLPCSTCHGDANSPASYGPNAPPGAPHWALPPPEHKMAWIGLSPAALCEAIKSKRENGGRNFEELIEHVSHDSLVLWGWQPGGTREPVPVPHDELVARFKQWAAAGGPCPGEQVANAVAKQPVP